VYSATFEQHLVDLDKIMTAVGNAGMTLKLAKCHFFEKEVGYLGHIITDEGIRPCPEKLKAVRAFPQPEGSTKVKSFLGLGGFYRRFVQGFSQVARPLFDLTRKGVRFKWSQAAEKAF
jgi:hypothetical protein